MHISRFKFICFLLMTLLALYFIFILDLGNDVRQKANPSNLFKFKISRKAAEKNLQHQEHIWPRNC